MENEKTASAPTVRTGWEIAMLVMVVVSVLFNSVYVTAQSHREMEDAWLTVTGLTTLVLFGLVMLDQVRRHHYGDGRGSHPRRPRYQLKRVQLGATHQLPGC
jgi:hypothetical protein